MDENKAGLEENQNQTPTQNNINDNQNMNSGNNNPPDNANGYQNNQWSSQKNNNKNNPLKNALKNKLGGAGNKNSSSQQTSPAGNNGGNANKGQNHGRKILNKMKKNAQPNDQKPNDANKKIERAAKLAKHAPIPQVKAAATAIEKLQKTKVGKMLGSKFLGGGGGGLLGAEEGSPEAMVVAAIRRKIVVLLLPVLLIVVVILLIVAVTSGGGSTTTYAGTTSGVLCMYDTDVLEEHEIDKKLYENCDNVEQRIKDYYERVKSIRQNYIDSGQDFNPAYIEGYRIATAYRGDDDNYDAMDEETIEILADSMFKDGSFDEDYFRKNLVEKILPAAIPGKNKKYYEKVANEIFEFVENFENLYHLFEDEEETDDSCIGPVTKLTKEQLCKLHGQGKYKEWVEKFGPVAQQDYTRTGVFASVTMAQAMIEAAWGCAGIGDNLFGIKCNTPALKKKYKCRLEWTHDGAHGEIYHQVSFFVANGFADGLNLHSQFLKLNQRYAKAGVFSAKNGKEQVAALKKAGYAEDSEYVTKLTGQINKYNLSKFDKKVNTPNDASCTSSIDASGGWSIRTVKPTSKDKAFTYKNSNRGQCVWYAQARAIEIAQDLAKKKKITDAQANKIKDKLLSIYGDGGQWYHAAKGIFKRSNKVKDLKAGSIISWTQNGKWGHVAVIENVTKKQVTITEGWANNVQSCPNSWGCVNFRSKTMSKSNFLNSYAKYYYPGKGYQFSGYIYFLEPES